MSAKGDRRADKDKRHLPAFRTDEEERAFWETHRAGDYLEDMSPGKVRVSRGLRERVLERKQNLTLRMEPSRVQAIKAIARQLGVGYQTLMRMWVNERLREEQARYTPGVPMPAGRSASRAPTRKVR
ncbi:MAG: CopG family antitoxin [Armatimonadota bacterium]